MKKIFYSLLLLLLSVDYTFALNVWDSNMEKTTSDTNVFMDIFSFDMLINIAFAILVIIFTFILSKVLSNKIWKFIEKNDTDWNKVELSGVITRTISITILTIGFTITLGFLWVDMWIFLWGFWFWLWFTLKIFLSNFIWWIIMVTQWSYHNWDLIKIGEKMWNIIKINSLFTEVKQFDWVVFYIPNVKFLENEVENFHINDKRRIEISIWVDFETDLVKAKKVILQVLNNFPGILKTPEPEVLIMNFNDNSINLNVRLWISSKWEYFVTKSNITETINLAFKQYWIKIPYPQITLSNRSDFNFNPQK